MGPVMQSHTHSLRLIRFSLGLGPSNDRDEPTLLEAALFDGANVTSVSCGAYHTLALTDSGRVFAFGWNKFGL